MASSHCRPPNRCLWQHTIHHPATSSQSSHQKTMLNPAQDSVSLPQTVPGKHLVPPSESALPGSCPLHPHRPALGPNGPLTQPRNFCVASMSPDVLDVVLHARVLLLVYALPVPHLKISVNCQLLPESTVWMLRRDLSVSSATILKFPQAESVANLSQCLPRQMLNLHRPCHASPIGDQTSHASVSSPNLSWNVLTIGHLPIVDLAAPASSLNPPHHLLVPEQLGDQHHLAQLQEWDSAVRGEARSCSDVFSLKRKVKFPQ